MKSKQQTLRINSSVLNLVQNHIKNTYRNSSNIQETWLFRYLYIFDKIYRGQEIMELDGVTIHINNIADKFNTKGKIFTDIVNFYKDCGIIYKTANYIVGISATQYRINAKYTEDIQKIKLNSNITIMENELKDENTFFKKYFQYLNQVKINIPLDKIGFGKTANKIIMEDIENKDWYYVQPVKQSRIYHNLCNIKRDYRKYLNWNNQEIYQADIRCSQVYLSLIQYLSYSGIPLEQQPQDIKNLYKECTNGTFYDSLMKITGHKDRNKFKQLFFKYVYYNKPETMNTKIAKAFEKLFPTMFDYVKNIKYKNGYVLFSVNLQKYEWNLISDILKKLYKNGIKAVNLHDAILFPKGEDNTKIEQIINDIYLTTTGYSPSIKTEKF